MCRLLGETTDLAAPKHGVVTKQEIRLERRTPEYWRVTLDNPPFNIFGPETIPQLNEVMTQLETDPKVKVVVFDSAVPGFFLTHYDFVPPLTDTTDIAPGPTGLPALPDMLVRLSRAMATSIARCPMPNWMCLWIPWRAVLPCSTSRSSRTSSEW